MEECIGDSAWYLEVGEVAEDVFTTPSKGDVKMVQKRSNIPKAKATLESSPKIDSKPVAALSSSLTQKSARQEGAAFISNSSTSKSCVGESKSNGQKRDCH